MGRSSRAQPSIGSRVLAALRRLFGWVPVRRTVQGARLWLPWNHRLPDYARLDPTYGQNLVEIARAIEPSGPFVFVDIGANIGDSTLQVLGATSSVTAVMVEADPYFLRYLRWNVRSSPAVRLEPRLLVPSASATARYAYSRSGGTTRFIPSADVAASRVITVEQLRTRYSGAGRVRLVKTDTDGHDTALVPAIAEAWRDETPIIFFEYDESLSEAAGDSRPSRVFDELARLGYQHLAIWDNYGHPLSWTKTDQVQPLLDHMRSAIASGEYYYWDVAAVHGEDVAGREAVVALVDVGDHG